MIFLVILLISSLGLAFHNPLLASMLWALGVSALHAKEETEGKLWSYFGSLTGAKWLNSLSAAAGFALIVAPALLLQSISAWNAFSGEKVDPFWFAVLIGARLGDGVFSHALPFLRATNVSANSTFNPGLATAVIYLLDGVLFSLFWRAPLAVAANEVLILGFTLGAGFFALVQPGLRLSGKFITAR